MIDKSRPCTTFPLSEIQIQQQFAFVFSLTVLKSTYTYGITGNEISKPTYTCGTTGNEMDNPTFTYATTGIEMDNQRAPQIEYSQSCLASQVQK